MFLDSSSTPVKDDSDAIQMIKAELKSIKCSDSSTGAAFQTLFCRKPHQCLSSPIGNFYLPPFVPRYRSTLKVSL